MKEIKIRVVTQNQVSQIFKNNNDFILNIVEDALRKWANDDAKLPDKISQIFDQNTQNRINCMPATIIPDKVSGMKWVSVFPANAPKGVQNVSGILENFRLCLIQRTLEELPDFEVMTWQLCRMLRSALNCFQVTRFCVQK